MLRMLLGTVVSFFVVIANAKVLVVADIDDTLRLTHRHGNYLKQLSNISDGKMVFSGLHSIFQSFHKEGAQIHYVTAAVKPFDEFSEKFLKTSQFPQRKNLYHKDWLDDTAEFKAEQILKIIKKVKPTEILLVGDNGEQDVAAYQAVAKKYPQTVIFIHKLYEGGKSSAVPASQYIFLTGADLAAQLEQSGFLTEAQALAAVKKVSADLASKKEYLINLVLPGWAELTAKDLDRSFGAYTGASVQIQKDLQQIEQKLFF